MGPIEELFFFDQHESWPSVFMKIRVDALVQHDYSLKVSKKPEFKNRNRYGDVSPYDYSRVCLVKHNIDYINASLVKYEPANRAYILTQGPLPDTSGHFWLMVWEQKSRAILMLNRIIEKGHIKCHQYYPTGEDGNDEMMFYDVGLKVTFVQELESNYNFTIRIFQLHNLETSESVQVMQFHYIAWPDFGVPESPSAFLDFLFAVRSFGVLDDPGTPPIIHCSAGIGRSGTFCLADTCLVLIEKERTIENLRVLDTLMEMRKYRMGLIQTHEQLRFSYLAIIEGASRISKDSNYFSEETEDDQESQEIERENYLNEINCIHEPNDLDAITEVNHDIGCDDLPPLPPRSQLSLSQRTQLIDSCLEAYDNLSLPRLNGSLSTGVVQNNDESHDVANENTNLQEIKRRQHDERVKKTRETIDKMKKRQQESEIARQQPSFGLYFYGGLSFAVALVGFAVYKFLNSSS